MNNNSTLLDLAKVQHGTFFYVNQHGNCRHTLVPSGFFSLFGTVYHRDALAYDSQGKTLYTIASARKLVDVWQPKVVFQLTANHTISFTGKKAESLWAAWRARIFGTKERTN